MAAASISRDADVVPYLNRIRTQDFVEHTVFANTKTLIRRAEHLNGFQRRALKILMIPGFENFMGIIIVANMFVMIIETDRSADEDTAGSNATHWTDVFGWVALAIFVSELAIRIIAYHCVFWQDKGNIFDFFIVALDTVFSLIGLAAGNLFPVSILRIFRLAKLARVSKVLRVFPELRLLLAGLISSVSAIFWGTLLLFLCLLVCSMVAVLFIHPLNKTVEYDESCTRCPHAYSSVMQATLTFWQQIVTGDSWGQATIPVIEKYPATVLYFVPVFLIVGMAVMNLILGVVVSAAQTAKEELEEEERTEKALNKLEQQSSLLELCVQMDTDNSGELSYEEIKAGLQEPGEFQDHLQALNITEEDFEIAWVIMDADASGTVSYKELVNYLCTMRSSDNNFMVAYIKYYITWIRHTLMDALEFQHQQTEKSCAKVESVILGVSEREDEILKDEKRILQAEEKILEEEEECRIRQDMIERSISRILAPVESEAGGTQQAFIQSDVPRLEMDGSPLVSQTTSPVRNSIGLDNGTNVASGYRRKNSLTGSLVGRSFSGFSGIKRSGSLVSSLPLSSLAPIDETQDWCKKLCDDIATMRSELKDMLTDMNRKLSSEAMLGTDTVRDMACKPEVGLNLKTI